MQTVDALRKEFIEMMKKNNEIVLIENLFQVKV